ncbi:MAG: thiamine pyrophosphate-binding protein [Clostridium sp.]|nr:thiamine pyrophosphate-binding protein [Clostridium sp.]
MQKTGNEKLIEQLMADDCYYMFGNPGTVEQGFLDAMGKYSDFHYITCMHESVAVAMADGYARKTGKPAVVQLHSGVGLGNGIGMLYQAMRGHAPLVVLAGEAGIKYDAMDAQMACDLVAMARPVTKWSSRVTHKASVLRMVRRAMKIAMTPPMGPVFLALPLDILDEVNTEPVYPTCKINTKTVTVDKEELKEIASLLANAVEPIFIVGDGVDASGASDALLEAAQLIGAAVYGADNSVVNFDHSSCLYGGDLGHMFGETSREKVKCADVVLIVGTYVFPEVFPCLESPFKEDAHMIHIDLNTYEIGKNHRVDIGIAADPECVLTELAAIITDRMTEDLRHAANERTEKMRQKKIKQDMSWQEGGTFDAFCKCLKEKTDDELIIFDEALTSSNTLNHYFRFSKAGSFFQTRGGSLGVGIPGAMGIKLASPASTVIGFTGDGGSMYTIQALQTAARYNIGAKLVILNNGAYQLLRDNMDQYWQEENIKPHEYPDCFSLQPAVDFVKMAQSMSVKAKRMDKAEHAEECVSWLLGDDMPALLEIVV